MILIFQYVALGVDILLCRCPAGGEADDGVGVVVLGPEAELHVLRKAGHGFVFDDTEGLVGRRIEAECIAVLHQCLADAVRRLNGWDADPLIQAVGEERVELQSELLWRRARRAA